MQLAALKTPRKPCQTWPGQVDKNFQGRTKVFNIIAEKFCPRIKIFGGTIFFLTCLTLANFKRKLLCCDTLQLSVNDIVYPKIFKD